MIQVYANNIFLTLKNYLLSPIFMILFSFIQDRFFLFFVFQLYNDVYLDYTQRYEIDDSKRAKRL